MAFSYDWRPVIALPIVGGLWRSCADSTAYPDSNAQGYPNNCAHANSDGYTQTYAGGHSHTYPSRYPQAWPCHTTIAPGGREAGRSAGRLPHVPCCRRCKAIPC